MPKFKHFSTMFILRFTRLQLRLLHQHILRCRRYYFYHLTDVFWHISRLSHRCNLLEHKLNAISKGD